MWVGPQVTPSTQPGPQRLQPAVGSRGVARPPVRQPPGRQSPLRQTPGSSRAVRVRGRGNRSHSNLKLSRALQQTGAVRRSTAPAFFRVFSTTFCFAVRGKHLRGRDSHWRRERHDPHAEGDMVRRPKSTWSVRCASASTAPSAAASGDLGRGRKSRPRNRPSRSGSLRRGRKARRSLRRPAAEISETRFEAVDRRWDPGGPVHLCCW